MRVINHNSSFHPRSAYYRTKVVVCEHFHSFFPADDLSVVTSRIKWNASTGPWSRILANKHSVRFISRLFTPVRFCKSGICPTVYFKLAIVAAGKRARLCVCTHRRTRRENDCQKGDGDGDWWEGKGYRHAETACTLKEPINHERFDSFFQIGQPSEI